MTQMIRNAHDFYKQLHTCPSSLSVNICKLTDMLLTWSLAVLYSLAGVVK